jgi:hypothetical protein
VTPQLTSPNEATAGPKAWKPSATCPQDLLKNLRANSDIYPYKTGRDGSKIFDSVASLAGQPQTPEDPAAYGLQILGCPPRFGSPQARAHSLDLRGPPSTTSSTPLTKRESFEARKIVYLCRAAAEPLTPVRDDGLMDYLQRWIDTEAYAVDQFKYAVFEFLSLSIG